MVVRTRFPESEKTHAASARPERAKTRTWPDGPWAALKRAWRAVGTRIPEMRDDLSCYAAVQADRVRLAASQIVTRVVFGLLLVIAAAVVFANAVSLVIVGTAGGVASALDGNVWLANLITGAAALVVLLLAIALSVRVRSSKRRRRLERRYQRHEARQRAVSPTGVPAREQPC